MNRDQELGGLPLRGKLAWAYAVSFSIAILMAVASIAGLFYGDIIYPTEELFQSFMPTDVTLLFIGLPMLIGSLWLARRGKLIGLLFWPGALFFVFYNYVVYIFAMALNWVFPLHLALVTLSVYGLVDLLARIDGTSVQQRLIGAVPERVSGGILAGMGLFFLLRVVVVIIGALTHQTPATELELGLLVVDFLISPAFIVCGILLWRRQAFGYVTSLGLLFQASMLFVGLIVLLLLQPFLTDVPFAPFDVIVVAIMGLICFIPFALCARGVVSRNSSSERK